MVGVPSSGGTWSRKRLGQGTLDWRGPWRREGPDMSKFEVTLVEEDGGTLEGKTGKGGTWGGEKGIPWRGQL